MTEFRQKLVCCSRGHIYDSNEYANCPHCARLDASGEGGAAAQVGEFGRTQAPGQAWQGTGGFGRTQAPSQASDGGAQGFGDFGRTQAPYQARASASSASGSQRTMSVRSQAYGAQGFGRGFADQSRTVMVDSSTTPDAPLPVVGWIVATDGPCKGTELRLHAGMNLIGRGPENDVCMRWDETVSVRNNSAIAYNADERRFFLSHVTGHGPTRLNGREVLRGQCELQALDRLVIGETSFVFVPLCGPGFCWEDETSPHDA